MVILIHPLFYIRFAALRSVSLRLQSLNQKTLTEYRIYYGVFSRICFLIFSLIYILIFVWLFLDRTREILDGFCGKKTANLWTGAVVYRQFRYEIMSVHLCCTFGARALHLYWHYYSKVFTDVSVTLLWYTVGIPMLYYRYRNAIPLVPGCFASLVPFFQFVYRQYQGEFSDEMQQDSSMRVWGWCEGREFTLTLTLTTETPINRAFQADCEGVRVKKEKKVFLFFGRKRGIWNRPGISNNDVGGYSSTSSKSSLCTPRMATA